MAFWNHVNRAANRLFFRDALLEESRRQVIGILEREGFTVGPAPDGLLKAYLPWGFREPDLVTFYARKMVQGADVEICEYERLMRYGDDSEGLGRMKLHLLAIVKHPKIVGGARISPDELEWDSEFKLVANFPPIAAIRAVAWGIGKLTRTHLEDRDIGHPILDRLYLIRSDSDEAAQRALTPALREFLLSLPFRWTIELRDGVMLASVQGAQMTLSDIGRLMEPLPRLIAAVLPSSQAFR